METNLGSKAVSLFFFFSGYGLMYKLSKDSGGYLKDFLKKRLVRIIIPLLTAYVVYIVSIYMGGNVPNYHRLFFGLLSFDPYLPYSWYVTEIILLYLSFYAVAKVSKSLKQVVKWLSVIISVLIVGGYMLHFESHLICSTFCFVMGINYQEYESSIYDWLHKRKILQFASVFVFAVMFNWVRIYNVLGISFIKEYSELYPYVANMLFTLVVVHLLQNTTFNLKNRYFISSSYELYLNQAAVFIVISTLTDNCWLMIVGSFLLCMVITPIIAKVNTSISKVLLQKMIG